MSVWVEIHCDNRRETYALRDPNNVLNHFCETNEGNNPAAMARSTVDVSTALRDAGNEAKTRGWVKRGRKWFCPRCAEATD